MRNVKKNIEKIERLKKELFSNLKFVNKETAIKVLRTFDDFIDDNVMQAITQDLNFTMFEKISKSHDYIIYKSDASDCINGTFAQYKIEISVIGQKYTQTLVMNFNRNKFTSEVLDYVRDYSVGDL